jgi:hypothetical protein
MLAISFSEGSGGGLKGRCFGEPLRANVWDGVSGVFHRGLLRMKGALLTKNLTPPNLGAIMAAGSLLEREAVSTSPEVELMETSWRQVVPFAAIVAMLHLKKN